MTNQEKTLKQRPGKLDLGMLATAAVLVFHLFITNIIGDEANGYLAFAREIYAVFFLLFGYGSSRVLSRMLKSRMARNQYRNAQITFRSVLVTALIRAAAGAVLLFFLSDILAEKLFAMKLSGISVRFFALLLLVNGFVQCFQGYFEGMGSRVPTMISRVIGALVTITGGIIAVHLFTDYGEKVGNLLYNEQFQPALASAGVAAGYVTGAVLTVIFLFLLYVIHQTDFQKQINKDTVKNGEKPEGIVRSCIQLLTAQMGTVAFIFLYRPVNLVLYSHFSRLIMPIEDGEALASATEDAALAVQNAVSADTASLTDNLGIYYGKTTVLLALMVVIVVLIRGSRRGRSSGFKNGKQLFGRNLQKLFSLSFFICFSMLALSGIAMQMLFNTSAKISVRLLGFGCITALFVILGVYLYPLAVEEMAAVVVLTGLIAFVVQTVAVVLLLKASTFGVLALAWGELIFWMIFSLGMLLGLGRQYRVRLNMYTVLVIPLTQALLMICVEVILVQLLKSVLNPWLLFFLAFGAGGCVWHLSERIPFIQRGIE
jgi:stage V sporulation protein B